MASFYVRLYKSTYYRLYHQRTNVSALSVFHLLLQLKIFLPRDCLQVPITLQVCNFLLLRRAWSNAHADIRILKPNDDVEYSGLRVELSSGPHIESSNRSSNLPQRFTYFYDIVFDAENDAFAYGNSAARLR